MKTYDTVRTEKKAIRLLQEWLNNQTSNENLSRDQYIEKTSIMCECGETQAMKAFYKGSDQEAVVGICDACGDDDAFASDVLQIR